MPELGVSGLRIRVREKGFLGYDSGAVKNPARPHVPSAAGLMIV